MEVDYGVGDYVVGLEEGNDVVGLAVGDAVGLGLGLGLGELVGVGERRKVGVRWE